MAYLQSSLDKLCEANKLAKVELGGAVVPPPLVPAGFCPSNLVSLWSPQGQPDSVQEALRFTMDVVAGK